MNITHVLTSVFLCAALWVVTEGNLRNALRTLNKKHSQRQDRLSAIRLMLGEKRRFLEARRHADAKIKAMMEAKQRLRQEEFLKKEESTRLKTKLTAVLADELATEKTRGAIKGPPVQNVVNEATAKPTTAINASETATKTLLSVVTEPSVQALEMTKTPSKLPLGTMTKTTTQRATTSRPTNATMMPDSLARDLNAVETPPDLPSTTKISTNEQRIAERPATTSNPKNIARAENVTDNTTKPQTVSNEMTTQKTPSVARVHTVQSPVHNVTEKSHTTPAHDNHVDRTSPLPKSSTQTTGKHILATNSSRSKLSTNITTTPTGQTALPLTQVSVTAVTSTDTKSATNHNTTTVNTTQAPWDEPGFFGPLGVAVFEDVTFPGGEDAQPRVIPATERPRVRESSGRDDPTFPRTDIVSNFLSEISNWFSTRRNPSSA